MTSSVSTAVELERDRSSRGLVDVTKQAALTALLVLLPFCTGCTSSDDSPAAPSSIPVSTNATTTTTTTIVNTTATTTTTTLTPVAVEQLAGGLVLCTYSGPVVPEDVIDRISLGLAAGVVLFASNVPDQQSALAATAAIRDAASQSPARAPAIVAVDQEGGLVARIPGPPSGSPSLIGSLSPDAIRDEGSATATNLAAWGINVDLAPVADVARNDGFLERQQRSYSSDPATAATAVAAFVQGLHRGRVAATLKHFPGLGAAMLNTDDSPSTVGLSAATLETVDRVPFVAGIGAGADLVMMSSARYPSVDAPPAVLSASWITLLKSQLKFAGVVATDAIDAPALSDYGSVGQRAVRAVAAGVDLVIVSANGGCIDIQRALVEAIDNGTISTARARDAYQRVNTLRRSR
jgi:beta-N-acetylhexosaminidase